MPSAVDDLLSLIRDTPGLQQMAQSGQQGDTSETGQLLGTSPQLQRRRASRASESLSAVPQFSALQEALSQKTGGVTLPVPPAAGGEVTPEPEGPPIDPGTPILGGVMQALDFMNRITPAVQTFGRYVDPNTGNVVSAPRQPGPLADPNNPGIDTRSSGIAGMLPRNPAFAVGSLIERVARGDPQYVEEHYGLSPWEQFRQGFTAKEEPRKLISGVMSPEGRGAWSVAETLPGAVIATASGIGSGITSIPGVIRDLIVGDRNVAEVIASTPNVVQSQVRAVREAYVKGVEGEVSGLGDTINGLMDGPWALLGKTPIRALGSFTGSQLMRLPLVSPMVHKTADFFPKLGDVVEPLVEKSGIPTGVNWLLKKTNPAVANTALSNTIDVLKGFFETQGFKGDDLQEAARYIRLFRDSEAKDLPYMSEYFARAPKDQVNYVHKLLKDNSPDVEVALRENLLAEPGARTVGTLLGDIGDAIHDNTLRALSKGSKKNLFGIIEQAQNDFASYWRPTVLYTRPVYLLNNLSSGAANAVLRFASLDPAAFTGAASIKGQAGIQVAWEFMRENDLLPHLKMGGPEIATLQPGYTATSHFNRTGFGMGVPGQSELPTFLKNFPVFGGVMSAEKRLAQVHEELTHVLATTLGWDTVRAELRSLSDDPLVPEIARNLLRGSWSEKQLRSKIDALLEGRVPPVEDMVPYTLLDHHVAGMLRAEVNSLSKQKSGLLQPDDIQEAITRTRSVIAQDGLLKRQIAADMEEFGATHLEDLLTISPKTRSAFGEQVRQKQLAAEQTLRDDDRDFLAVVDGQTLSAWDWVKRHRKDEVTPKWASRMAQASVNRIRNATETHSLYRSAESALSKEYHELAALENKKMWDWYIPMQKRRGESPEIAQEIDDTWQAFYEGTLRRIEARELRQENLRRLTIEALQKKQASSTLNQRMAALPKNWRDDTTQIALGEDVVKAYTTAAQKGREMRQSRKEFEELAMKAGWQKSDLPGNPPNHVEVAERDIVKALRGLEGVQAEFTNSIAASNVLVNGERPRYVGQGMTDALGGIAPDELIGRFRQSLMIGRDKLDHIVRKNQVDYTGDRRNIDRVMGMLAPFSMWQSRYMLGQVENFVRDPAQSLMIMRTLKSWWDSNEGKSPWSRFDIHVTTLDAGTPDEVEVKFNPLSMVYPLGFSAGEVVRAVDSKKANKWQQGFELLQAGFGGQMWPWVPVIAGATGMMPEGGPPNTVGDMLKTMSPLIDWPRQSLVAATAGQGWTQGLLTEREKDGAIRKMTDDVNKGLLHPDLARQAAATIKRGEANELGLGYLQQTSPERFANTLGHALGPYRAQDLGQRITNQAWETLKAARTESERQMVFQTFPGFGINLTGKSGDKLELALINAEAPMNPLMRSAYYQQHSPKIRELSERIDRADGKDPTDWQMKSATPESFEAFRMAGGSALVPDLINYWQIGKPLPNETVNKLHTLYNTYGMGALNYQQWRDTLLSDAYRQWVANRMTTLRGISPAKGPITIKE